MSSGAETCSGEVDMCRKKIVTSWIEGWIDEYLLTIPGVVMLIVFLIGVLCGWQCKKACGSRKKEIRDDALEGNASKSEAEERTSKVEAAYAKWIEKHPEERKTQDKQSQAPCTYKWKYASPRFAPLPESSHG